MKREGHTAVPLGWLRAWINRHLRLKAVVLLCYDLLWGLRLRLGWIDTDCGATHGSLEVDESIRYVEGVYDGYRRAAGVERFRGVVVELGPGDNAGVALLMRRDGCERVDLVDRYRSRRKPDQQDGIYRALSDKHDLDRFRLSERWDDARLSGIDWRCGRPAEAYFADARQRRQRYDFIGSWAVLEHLYNPLGALVDMVACLKTGGLMAHVVDLRDHGMFSQCHDELAFLSIPRFFYRRMTRNSGGPNRLLIHRYRDVLEGMRKEGLIDFVIRVTSLVGVGSIDPWVEYGEIDVVLRTRTAALVEERRSRLATEFCGVSTDDLSVTGVVLSVRRGDRTGAGTGGACPGQPAS